MYKLFWCQTVWHIVINVYYISQSALQEEARNQEAEVRANLQEEVAQREEEWQGRVREAEERGRREGDRKSTRLNSSHL